MRTIGFSRHGARRWSRRGPLHASSAFNTATLDGCSTSGSSPGIDNEHLAWPARSRWPARFRNATAHVQEADRFAVASQDLLQCFPCFCGCGTSGHTSNRDCYVRETRADGSTLRDPKSFG